MSCEDLLGDGERVNPLALNMNGFLFVIPPELLVSESLVGDPFGLQVGCDVLIAGYNYSDVFVQPYAARLGLPLMRAFTVGLN